MDAREYARRYAEAEVTVVDRGRLLLLVFEGGLKFLHLTREALAAGDLPRFAEHLGRSQAIVAELLGTLDRKAGGDLATDLARLYEFMIFHLTEANVQKSVRHVDQVIGVLGTIAGAYREIIEGRPATVAPPAPAPAAAL
jgi:flagellar protein FliS